MAHLRIAEYRGVTEQQAETLKAHGITNGHQLLERAGAPDGRRELAAATGLSTDNLLELLNRADLSRIHGIGRQYSNLLEDVGVDTVPELAQRNPANLHVALVEAAAGSGVQRPPTLSQVESWVNQAKELPRAISY
jgi:predicted flap endonuclease-1-like 5' DNA nuclease